MPLTCLIKSQSLRYYIQYGKVAGMSFTKSGRRKASSKKKGSKKYSQQEIAVKVAAAALAAVVTNEPAVLPPPTKMRSSNKRKVKYYELEEEPPAIDSATRRVAIGALFEFRHGAEREKTLARQRRHHIFY